MTPIGQHDRRHALNLKHVVEDPGQNQSRRMLLKEALRLIGDRLVELGAEIADDARPRSRREVLAEVEKHPSHEEEDHHEHRHRN